MIEGLDLDGPFVGLRQPVLAFFDHSANTIKADILIQLVNGLGIELFLKNLSGRSSPPSQCKLDCSLACGFGQWLDLVMFWLGLASAQAAPFVALQSGPRKGEIESVKKECYF